MSDKVSFDKVSFSIYVQKDFLDKLKAEAIARKITLTGLISYALEKTFDKNGEVLIGEEEIKIIQNIKDSIKDIKRSILIYSTTKKALERTAQKNKIAINSLILYITDTFYKNN